MEHPRTDAAPQPDAIPTPPAEALAADPAPGEADGKIVAIESGRQRREGRSPGERNREERLERRERRKHRVDGDIAADAPMAPAFDDAIVAVEGSLPDESAAELAAAGQRILTAPLMPSDSPERSVERTRSQLEAAERAVAGNPEVTAVVAPLVRHVNTVTEQLNSAQLQLGRTVAERDALRLKVAELLGVDVSEVSIIDSLSGQTESGAGIQLRAVDASASGRQPDAPAKPSRVPAAIDIRVGSDASPEHVRRIARKRQLIAACLFTAIGIGFVIAQRQGNDVSSFSRDSLGSLAGIGIFFNIFFMVWMLYRVVRVGGKGAKWLFPQEPTKRRR